ncbi:MAG: hypothetical protein AABZ30_10540, partial [Myxococcota bacterium]
MKLKRGAAWGLAIGGLAVVAAGVLGGTTARGRRWAGAAVRAVTPGAATRVGPALDAAAGAAAG